MNIYRLDMTSSNWCYSICDTSPIGAKRPSQAEVQYLESCSTVTHTNATCNLLSCLFALCHVFLHCDMSRHVHVH